MSDYPNLLIAVGASAGGFKEVLKLVDCLPEDIQASLVIAMHRDPARPNMLADILRARCNIEVCEPDDDQPIECATVYVGSPKDRVEVEKDGTFDLQVDSSRFARLARIDDLFSSVAKTAGGNAVGVVLSGMLWDGVAGLRAIKEGGGTCIVQDPEEAQYQSMPVNALKEVAVDFVGTTEEISSQIQKLAAGRECE